MTDAANAKAGSTTAQADWRVILCAVAIVTLVGVSLSIAGPLLAFEMERWGTPTTLAGLTATLSGLGNMVLVAFVPQVARLIGVRRLVIIALLAASGLHVAFWLLPSLPLWALFRFLLGGAIGTLFVLSEYWIITAAPAERRGVIMGAYATALAIGFACGPALLSLTGTSGALPYVATALIILSGLIPLALIGRDAPSVHEKTRKPVLGFIRLAPAAIFAAFAVGAIEIAMFAQLSIHGLRLGFPEKDAALLISAFALGNVLFQVPIGWLADRFDRRKLLFVTALIAAILGFCLLLTGQGFWLNAVTLMLIGGLTGALYTVGLAHLGGRFTDSALVSANAAFIMLYSLGMMIGPFMAGAGIDLAGIAGLPITVGVILGSYAMLVLWRMSKSG